MLLFKLGGLTQERIVECLFRRCSLRKVGSKARMNLTKQCCNGPEMRIFILLLAAAVLIDGRCEALNLRKSQYNRTLIACEDRLVAWNNVTAAGQAVSPTTPSATTNSDGVFIRGKWKQVSGVHSSRIVRPPFVSSSQGMFDFFSSQWTGALDANRPTIQNFSGELFFWDDRDQRARPGYVLEATGVYNSQSGEVCLVACLTLPLTFGAAPTRHETQNVTNITENANLSKPSNEEYSQDCSVRGLLTISGSSRMGRKFAEGALESLEDGSDIDYFTSVSLMGSMMTNKDQQALYHFDLFVRSSLFGIEAAIVIWQIVHSVRSPSSYFVSTLMILVQILVICFLALHLIYLPLRLLTYQRLKYLISSVALVPFFVLTAIVLLNSLFFWLIDRKRRVAKRLNVEERPQELISAAVCMAIYAITGVLLWSLQNFETYLEVVWCWFLLPQVIANVFWDLRTQPLQWIYIIGVSLCRIVYIGFNALRRTVYGHDDLNDFPHSWFWGITGTVLIFASFALLQQRYGGRSFLPQSWFGYQQLPSSKTRASLDPDDEDRMFDL